MRIIIKILRKNGVNYTSRISNTQAIIRPLNKMHIFCIDAHVETKSNSHTTYAIIAN